MIGIALSPNASILPPTQRNSLNSPKFMLGSLALELTRELGLDQLFDMIRRSGGERGWKVRGGWSASTSSLGPSKQQVHTVQ